MSRVVIYSNKRIEGLVGKYIAPHFFDEKQLKGVEKVYTVDEEIEKVCKVQKIPVEFVGKRKTVKNSSKDK